MPSLCFNALLSCLVFPLKHSNDVDHFKMKVVAVHLYGIWVIFYLVSENDQKESPQC